MSLCIKMLTNKQKQEIEFLEIHFGGRCTPYQKKEYIDLTVYGKGKKYEIGKENNPLVEAKRKLDINVKMWAKDMHDGILAHWELTEDFKHPFMDRIVAGIRKGLKNPDISYGKLGVATIAWLNYSTNQKEAVKQLDKVLKNK